MSSDSRLLNDPLPIAAIVVSVIFGLGLIIIGYNYIASDPSVHPRLYQIYRMGVAFGAGFVAAGLAGSFQIEGKWPPVTVKAGGPIGIAVFFYAVNPTPFG